MLRHAPSVIGIRVDRFLIAIVCRRTGTALPEIVRPKIFQKDLRPIPLVVAARTLREGLWRNIPSVLAPELPVVFAFDPADVIDKLVEVLDRGLGSIAIRPNVQTVTEVKQKNIGELVESRILEVASGNILLEAVETHPEFVGHSG